jgi:hypothetical protein
MNLAIIYLIIICIIIYYILHLYFYRKPFLILYIPNFLTDTEHQTIKQNCQVYTLEEDDNPYIKNRMFYQISQNDPVHNIIYSEKNNILVSNNLKVHVKSDNNTPIEYRVYKTNSSMTWHIDDIMYKIPQYECVYTVENTSNSLTQYKDRFGMVHSIWTEPNSLLIVRAGDIEHRVTSITTGNRTILKYSYIN